MDWGSSSRYMISASALILSSLFTWNSCRIMQISFLFLLTRSSFKKHSSSNVFQAEATMQFQMKRHFSCITFSFLWLNISKPSAVSRRDVLCRSGRHKDRGRSMADKRVCRSVLYGPCQQLLEHQLYSSHTLQKWKYNPLCSPEIWLKKLAYSNFGKVLEN